MGTKFNEDPACAVLVLTLHVGSVGLTLTAATHVVHFDRCWNPAKEAQATDRAHRIGQRCPVVVHRLITLGTFEERLAAVLDRKRALASSAVLSTSGGNAGRALAECSDADLRMLFIHSAGATPVDARPDLNTDASASASSTAM